VTPFDEASFGAFYERTARPLWSYVYRVTGHAADADDIVQDAFCRLLRADVRDRDEDRRRYVYRIASNLVIDRWRRSGREPAMEDERALQAIAAAAPADEPEVARTFAALAPRDRALLWLAYVEEESHAEIAASLGVGTRSVKVLLFRARRRLRSLLSARGVER
jgi:RNA polymerase sigma-70 factor (ECF subfamily)